MTISKPDRSVRSEEPAAETRAIWAAEDAEEQRDWDRYLLNLRRRRERQRAEENDAWNVSRERKMVLRVSYATAAIACVLFFAAYLLVQTGTSIMRSLQWNLPMSQWVVLVSSAAVTVLILAIVVMLAKYATARHTFLADYRLDKKKDDLTKREMELIRLDLESLWSLTQRRLDLYHDIATGQAEKSYRNSRIATGLGFVILIFAVILSVISSTTGGAIAAAVVGITGGALAAYLGKTFLRTSESSTQQLRSYFEQPLTFSQHLAAERLLATLDPTDRSAATQGLIERISKSRLEETSALKMVNPKG